MRRPHYLRGNLRSETVHEAVWFDTETDPIQLSPDKIGHTLRFGMACYSRRLPKGGWSKGEWCRFERIGCFWSWLFRLQRDRTTIYAFCHNTSFDLPVLDCFSVLPAEGWSLKCAIIDAPPTILKFKKGTRQLIFLDTLNFWRVPLKTLGQQIGLPKLDMPADTSAITDFDIYCKRDVEILRKACIDWWKYLQANDLGGFAPTLASQAFRTYRHRFMTHKLFVDANKPATALSRSAYYGGRVECFTIGKIKDRVYRDDVNSMYPFVMDKFEYPTKLKSFYKRVTISELTNILKKYCVCAHVNITTEENCFPLRYDNKLIFPIGTYDTYLSTPELLYALQRNMINKIYAASIYIKHFIFKSFVKYMYRNKLKAVLSGNKGEAFKWKILLNSLYGKFGQRGIVFETAAQCDPDKVGAWAEIDAETGKLYKYRALAGITQVQTREAESRDSIPAIAAHVTAYARMHLWYLINIAGLQNVHYCDTDCVWCNAAGHENLRGELDEFKLGKLKNEGVDEGGEIFGPKDYCIGELKKTKGVRRTAIHLRENTYQQEKWTSLRGQLRIGTLNLPTTESVIKTLQRQYNKGRLLPSGRTLPFRIGTDIIL